MEDLERAVKDLIDLNRLSASKVKSITDLAISNVENDASLVSLLFRTHKKAPQANKLSSLYVVDAIAREARTRVKKKQDKASQCERFLGKLEGALEKIVDEVLDKGKPEHRGKVKKVLDIWSKSSTFGSSVMKRLHTRTDSPPRTDPASAPITPERDQPVDLPSAASAPGLSNAPAQTVPLPANLLAVLGANGGASASGSPSLSASVDTSVQKAIQDVANGAGTASSAPVAPLSTSLTLDPAQLQLLASIAQNSRAATTAATGNSGISMEVDGPLASTTLNPRASPSNNERHDDTGRQDSRRRNSRSRSPPPRKSRFDEGPGSRERSRDYTTPTAVLATQSIPQNSASTSTTDTPLNPEPSSGSDVPFSGGAPQAPNSGAAGMGMGAMRVQAQSPGGGGVWANFDPTTTESWEHFGRWATSAWGYIPTNEQLMAWICGGAPPVNIGNRMSVMQALGGVGNMGGMGNMSGMGLMNPMMMMGMGMQQTMPQQQPQQQPQQPQPNFYGGGSGANNFAAGNTFGGGNFGGGNSYSGGGGGGYGGRGGFNHSRG